ncbi:hypothetical protein [Undibacterium luofuense]|uniref:Uncharacterized protein n=1 Tax=Undibacterium luofuense TaxID=2828733 RepID=A0A941I664_9BURK|nr:hypothetical protein [Undibacterium luofuense]MBR7783537.1 hypothetical protein [Undibacterium luofuense]
MSEMMTAEGIIEAEWLLAGYWTKPRFALQTEAGHWSDIDVLSYEPESRHLVVSESKVQGSRHAVFAYTEYTRETYGDILRYDGDQYFSFLRHLPLICTDGTVFKRFGRQVKRLTIQLVCNYAVDPALLDEVQNTVMQRIHALGLPPDLNIDFRLDSTLEVLCRVMEQERESEQNRRYGNPVLDIARELNRYLQPQVKNAGRSQQAIDAVRQQLRERLLQAFVPER